MHHRFIYPLLFTLTFFIAFLRVVSPAHALVATPPNFTVAFIGDSANGSNANAVRTLIKNYNDPKYGSVDAVIHQGDFGYGAIDDAFFTGVDQYLAGSGNVYYPYFGSVGNHDISEWNSGCNQSGTLANHNLGCYREYFKKRIEYLGLPFIEDPNLTGTTEEYSTVYQGLKMVFIGQTGTFNSGYTNFIKNQLQNDDHIWKICSWHKNMAQTQVGGKPDTMLWAHYDTCRQYGAIIAQGHEHSYERSLTFDEISNGVTASTVDHTVHPLVNGIPSNPNQLIVAPGKTFLFVSGLGGNSIRVQQRCTPFTYPYSGGDGCHYFWGDIQTSDQPDTNFGPLIIAFNVDGNPNKAVAKFVSISNGNPTLDSFTIFANTTNPPSPTYGPSPTNLPTPTKTPTPIPQVSTTPTPTPTAGPTLPPGSSQTLNPVADIWGIDGGTVNNSQPLQVDGTGTSSTQISYLKFDLTQFAPSTILSATLRLYITNVGAAGQNEFITEVTDDSWTETSTTLPLRGSTVTTFDGSTSGWHEIDITPWAQANSGDFMSLAINQIHTNGMDFNGREHANSPQLVLTTNTSTTPPPATPTPIISPTPTPVPGDTDGDFDVDIFDYSDVITNFGTNLGPACAVRPDGDVAPFPSGDCKVDIMDYSEVIANFGTSAPNPT